MVEAGGQKMNFVTSLAMCSLLSGNIFTLLARFVAYFWLKNNNVLLQKAVCYNYVQFEIEVKLI